MNNEYILNNIYHNYFSVCISTLIAVFPYYFDFSEDRVRNGVKKLMKARQGSTQGRLDNFFKVLPSNGPTKRKVRILIFICKIIAFLSPTTNIMSSASNILKAIIFNRFYRLYSVLKNVYLYFLGHIFSVFWPHFSLTVIFLTVISKEK